MKVLLVGISAELGSIVAKALGARGHDELRAPDGAGAIELVARDAPQLVIVQDDLPDMSAAEVCRRARAHPGGADAIILVITSHADALPAVLDAGATDLYTTSLGPAALEARLLIAERHVERHAALRKREFRFRRLFDSGVAGVIIWDIDGNFKEANCAFLRMLGYAPADRLAGKLNWENDHSARTLGSRHRRPRSTARDRVPSLARERVHPPRRATHRRARWFGRA